VKTLNPSSINPAGIEMVESIGQYRNAKFPIRESLEPDSNLTIESLAHRAKHPAQITSTLDGIETDESNEHAPNADFPIRESRESRPNVTVDRRTQE
jgi:hypothetical protein